jgi:MFS family permease
MTEAKVDEGEQERKGLRSSFRALQNPVYRKYFIGQGLTRTGNWTQDIAQSWFVFEQTGSGTAVGVLLACEFLPILLLSLWAGSLTDRHSKRQLLLITQSLFVVLAAALAAVVALDAPLELLFVIAAVRGVVLAVNITAGTAFTSEIVPKKDMRSASSLNGLLFNLGRVIGALLAAVLVQLAHISWCFLLNAVFYAVVVVLVWTIRPHHIDAAPRQTKAGVVDGLRYAWNVPELRAAIVVMFGVGLLAYNSQVFFATLSEDVFDNNLSMYSWLMGLYSAGFIIMSLIGAAGTSPSNRMMLRAAVAMGTVMLVEAVVAPVPAVGLLAIVLWGAASGMLGSRINTMVQLHSSAEMKGRVMAMWSIVMWGTTPIGAPLVGFVAEQFGARVSIFVAGAGVLVCCIYAWSILRDRLDHVAQH